MPRTRWWGTREKIDARDCGGGDGNAYTHQQHTQTHTGRDAPPYRHTGMATDAAAVVGATEPADVEDAVSVGAASSLGLDFVFPPMDIAPDGGAVGFDVSGMAHLEDVLAGIRDISQAMSGIQDISQAMNRAVGTWAVGTWGGQGFARLSQDETLKLASLPGRILSEIADCNGCTATKLAKFMRALGKVEAELKAVLEAASDRAEAEQKAAAEAEEQAAKRAQAEKRAAAAEARRRWVWAGLTALLMMALLLVGASWLGVRSDAHDAHDEAPQPAGIVDPATERDKGLAGVMYRILADGVESASRAVRGEDDH